MKNLGYKFALIALTTALGLIALYPPREKLKLGIDLSGGTILVYEVVKENLDQKTFNMNELISTLKTRIDPNGVQEIPIRQIGGNRFEIILPEKSAEEVEEVKRNLTDVGALEFRILANQKHDKDVIDRALSPGGMTKAPSRYMWAKLGEVSTGKEPRFTDTKIIDPNQSWKKNIYNGQKVELTGKGSSGGEETEALTVKSNTGTTLTLAQPIGLKTVTSYRIEYNPSNIRGGDPTNPRGSDPIIREEKVAPGRSELYILCVKDRQEVSGKYLNPAGVRATTDEHLQPAVGFAFNHQGARKFGTLTRRSTRRSAIRGSSKAVGRGSRPRRWNT
jgi:SecD/SecF fusion protein